MKKKIPFLLTLCLVCGLGASRTTGQPPAVPSEPARPIKLPFGLELADIEKAAPSPVRLPFGLELQEIEQAAGRR